MLNKTTLNVLPEEKNIHKAKINLMVLLLSVDRRSLSVTVLQEPNSLTTHPVKNIWVCGTMWKYGKGTVCCNGVARFIGQPNDRSSQSKHLF